MTVRSFIAAILLSGAALSTAQAEPERGPRLGSEQRKQVAIKPASSNPCTQFGAGFVRVEGSTTCVKVGGAISAGVGVAR